MKLSSKNIRLWVRSLKRKLFSKKGLTMELLGVILVFKEDAGADLQSVPIEVTQVERNASSGTRLIARITNPR